MTAATMTKTEALAIARQARRYGHWGDLFQTTRGPCRWAAPGANSACTPEHEPRQASRGPLYESLGRALDRASWAT